MRLDVQKEIGRGLCEREPTLRRFLPSQKKAGGGHSAGARHIPEFD
jgi:hypothetical protein